MPPVRPRVAIACQGGGSHTAFSAGALKSLLASPDHEVVAFSGTSGGAIDALLAWYGLLAGDGPAVGARLEAFWDDISAGSLADALFNAWSLAAYRMLAPVVAPEVSPYLYPEVASKELRATLERHVDFDAVPALVRERRERGPVPLLLVGAVDVRSGRFEVFRNDCPPDGDPTLEVTADAVLASAAVPTLFRTVTVRRGEEELRCWDGLFSQNPPVRDLPEAQPDEIWVLQINPTERLTEPTQMADIRDRRNELAGNLSLRQELHFIEKINKLVRGHRAEHGPDATLTTVEVDAQGTRTKRTYREITVRCIQIPEEAAHLRLDTESKLDRSPRFIRALFDLGEREAAAFLAARGDGGYRWRDDG